MQNFCFSRPVCLLIVFVASCSLVFASENVETADEEWRRMENRLVSGLRNFLSDVAEPNDNYVETLEPCFNFVIKDSSKPLKNLTHGKLLMKMVLIMQCVIIIDTIAVPYNAYHGTKSALGKMKWKGSAINQKMDNLVSLPLAIFKPAAIIPSRTLFKLGGIFLGTLMTIASVNV